MKDLVTDSVRAVGSEERGNGDTMSKSNRVTMGRMWSDSHSIWHWRFHHLPLSFNSIGKRLVYTSKVA